MQCQTVLAGTECVFWSKKGCIAEGGSCQNVIEMCEGCDHIVDGTIGPVCGKAPAPVKKWSAGLCNFATHRKVEVKNEEIKVNPIKASKRAGR